MEKIGKNLQKSQKNFAIILKKLNQIQKISAYGASARSSTLINYLNLNNKLIDVVFDKNKLKTNLFTPGTHIKILKLQEVSLIDINY